MATKELGFKKPLSKEERIMKKKERLAAIGNSSGLNLKWKICGWSFFFVGLTFQ